MAYWESLTNWSLAMNLDDLAASIPFFRQPSGKQQK
jgi:hypothetical protein